MSGTTYRDIFKRSTQQESPYAYQCRLACGSEANLAETSTLCVGTDCKSQLIQIPTGYGKTAAVVLAWLWNRVLQPDQEARKNWPRRLVYCLPMRTLVEQTHDETVKWLNAHGLLWDGKGPHEGKVGLHILMGGEEAGEWALHPECDAILIGTQDMLLSSALNRGYGMSRYRWPMYFGLLNNDCLWVMDETQLMGPALWTSAQLDWMRHNRFRSLFASPTWWMSATVGDDFLKTSDRTRNNFPMPPVLELGDEPNAGQKLGARRPCTMWNEPPRAKKKASAKTAEESGASEFVFVTALSASVVNEHVAATLSLVICNTVATAQALFAAIQKSSGTNVPCILLTSRFRKGDRKKYVETLLAFEEARKNGTIGSGVGLICISTQVVEAGVDVSATRLWSEVAPWPSLLQRMGRLNRDGRSNGAARAIFFRVPDADSKAKKGARVGPYVADAVTRGGKILAALVEVSDSEPELSALDALAKIRQQSAIGKEIAAALQPVPEPYPRAIDIHGLFSTEPDVFGGFTDVSPFVRDSDDDSDVTVFWRKDVSSRASAASRDLDGPTYDPSESVRVSVGSLRKLLDTGGQAWLWNDKTERWDSTRIADICPGMVLMLRASSGGYDPFLGWTGKAKDRIEDAPPPGPFDDDFDDNKFTATGDWQELAAHLSAVENAAKEIAARLSLPKHLEQSLTVAAKYHDIGKSLPAWQSALPQPPPSEGKLWAKSRFLLAVRPNNKAFRPELVEQLLRDAGIAFKVGIPPQYLAADSVHCWQICSYVKNTKARKWKKELGDLPGVGRMWHVPFRPGLRHEAGSALALWWQYFRNVAEFPGLTIYLAAAHHGKVRTVLQSRGADETDVCGIIPTADPLKWENGMPMDFACAGDGTSGSFSEDGLTFGPDSPGWTALVADLLGAPAGENQQGSKESLLCLSSRESEVSHLGPFALAYMEALIVAADVRPEFKNTTITKNPATL